MNIENTYNDYSFGFIMSRYNFILQYCIIYDFVDPVPEIIKFSLVLIFCKQYLTTMVKNSTLLPYGNPLHHVGYQLYTYTHYVDNKLNVHHILPLNFIGFMKKLYSQTIAWLR